MRVLVGALRRTLDWERANPPNPPAGAGAGDDFDYAAEDRLLERLGVR